MLLTPAAYVATFCGVAYPWLLPALAEANFAVKGSHSISAFIETPSATAGMAIATVGPIWLMFTLENQLREKYQGVSRWIRQLSFYGFLIAFAGFLICNVSKYEIAHYVFVGTFVLMFGVHAFLRLHDLENKWAKLTLIIGGAAFLVMIVLLIADVDSIAFWAVECVGFTMLLLFTPLELAFMKTFNTNNYELFL